MNKQLFNFAGRLREMIFHSQFEILNSQFNSLALELSALQFQNNFDYRKICASRKLTPQNVGHWTQIPAVPTAAFKDLEMTSLASDERTAVFYSSGTTGQKPGRHFHSAESLKIYEASLISWFLENVPPDLRFTIYDLRLVCLTPPPAQTPHSSLVHMFETVRKKFNAAETVFTGKISADGAWTLDFDAVLTALNDNAKLKTQNLKLILGTAFSFVHLLDFLAENNLRFQLPENSRVMETGGYKNRSRSLPKEELHSLVEKFLGVPRENIICEYGMSELSSQAYETRSQKPEVRSQNEKGVFQFPAWTRTQIISPETGREVAEGETGLIRIFDLANVFSVAAIQTEDLGIRRGDGFELVGRAQTAEPRGCSLMTI